MFCLSVISYLLINWHKVTSLNITPHSQLRDLILQVTWWLHCCWCQLKKSTKYNWWIWFVLWNQQTGMISAPLNNSINCWAELHSVMWVVLERTPISKHTVVLVTDLWPTSSLLWNHPTHAKHWKWMLSDDDDDTKLMMVSLV